MSSRLPRLKFESVERKSDGGRAWLEVTLSFGGRSLTRRSPDVNGGELAEARASALATIAVIESFVDGQFRCELQEVECARALEKELVVLLMNLAFEGRHVQVFGSCRTGSDTPAATARAALDATNRYIGLVLEPEQGQ